MVQGPNLKSDEDVKDLNITEIDFIHEKTIVRDLVEK